MSPSTSDSDIAWEADNSATCAEVIRWSLKELNRPLPPRPAQETDETSQACDMPQDPALTAWNARDNLKSMVSVHPSHSWGTTFAALRSNFDLQIGTLMDAYTEAVTTRSLVEKQQGETSHDANDPSESPLTVLANEIIVFRASLLDGAKSFSDTISLWKEKRL